jgi:hypothetical protein
MVNDICVWLMALENYYNYSISSGAVIIMELVKYGVRPRTRNVSVRQPVIHAPGLDQAVMPT